MPVVLIIMLTSTSSSPSRGSMWWILTWGGWTIQNKNTVCNKITINTRHKSSAINPIAHGEGGGAHWALDPREVILKSQI